MKLSGTGVWAGQLRYGEAGPIAEVAGELDPAVVRPADGSDYVCVVMPMRL